MIVVTHRCADFLARGVVSRGYSVLPTAKVEDAAILLKMTKAKLVILGANMRSGRGKPTREILGEIDPSIVEDPFARRVSHAQLELLQPEPGVSNVEVQVESERPPLQPAAKTKRQHQGRQELPPNLPRVEPNLNSRPLAAHRYLRLSVHVLASARTLHRCVAPTLTSEPPKIIAQRQKG
jgi:hypothetical protein